MTLFLCIYICFLYIYIFFFFGEGGIIIKNINIKKKKNYIIECTLN